MNKRIYINKDGLKVVFPDNKTFPSKEGKGARMYGSSKLLYNEHKTCYYIDTDNHILLDGELIE